MKPLTAAETSSCVEAAIRHMETRMHRDSDGNDIRTTYGFDARLDAVNAAVGLPIEQAVDAIERVLKRNATTEVVGTYRTT